MVHDMKRVLFFLLCLCGTQLNADIPYLGTALNSANKAFDYANGNWAERGAAVAGAVVGCLILSCTIPDTTAKKPREDFDAATITRIHTINEILPGKNDVGSCALASPFKCAGIGVVATASFFLLHHLLKQQEPQARLVAPAIVSFVWCAYWAPNIKYTFGLYGATLAGAAFGAAACYGIRSAW